ncbi:hypothetical protein A2619_01205 [candidate division WWE3 bacterium RIFOXYD1_FULL_39_9]|uniref:Uncharacterized protein n=1 Tax=candidate division WWE3 bacterium RIFOXYD1_FULL_39_9 TaxID=1802649 RepID=A0A1F4X6F1_UNCKA|nr:MAG: hypothetical protein A2619_01205 [candidate division WWE3 bacterium RIFOXYD1_FULL_39_9]
MKEENKELSINLNAIRKNRLRKGIWVPEEIHLSSLSWPEKILWLEIDCLSQDGGVCVASNSYFADFLGVGEASITRYILNLKELGLIQEVKKTDGRHRYLKTNHEQFDKFKAILRFCK